MADNFPKSQIVLLELPACLYVYQQPSPQPATSTPPQHTASGTSHTTQALCDRVPFGSRGASRMEAHMHHRLPATSNQQPAASSQPATSEDGALRLPVSSGCAPRAGEGCRHGDPSASQLHKGPLARSFLLRRPILGFLNARTCLNVYLSRVS